MRYENSKYDFDLDIGSTNSLSLILSQIKRGSNVLEFGPANGRMTKYLKEVLDCNVYLVEIDEEAGKEALQYGVDMVVDDIETYSWMDKYENIRFDYITFADVLEHLRDPEQVLIRSKMLLKQDGSIILSVPNLAHNAVLINLMNNEFEYNRVGLLDNTHIHFFTKNNLENTLSRTGLTVAKRYATYAPVGSIEIENTYSSVAGIDESFWKSRLYGDIYQFIYEVKKGPEFVTETQNHIKGGTNPYYLQVYYDRGKGFSEDDTKTFAIENIYGDQKFELEIDQDVRNLRIDPFNAPCMIEEFVCVDTVEGEELPLRLMDTNAGYRNHNTYVFNTPDPITVFGPAVGRKFNKITIRFRYVTVDAIRVGAVGQVWDDSYKQVAFYKEEDQKMRKEKEELEDQVDALRGQADHLSRTLNEALSSRSWKITKPLRKLGNILRR